MIPDNITHIRESSEDTERHLSENREKFETDCVFLLRLMIQGKRLTRQMVSDMKINERRLGDLFEDGKCQREWIMKPNGKRSHVEYFVTNPSYPTKSATIERAGKVIDLLTKTEKNLVTVFSLDDEPPKYIQPNLF